MGLLIKQGACPNEDCGSSDGFSVYEQEDGSHNGTCFVCEHFAPNVDVETMTAVETTKGTNKPKGPSVQEVYEYPIRGLKERKLRKDSCEFYEMRVGYSEKDGKTIDYHYYPFHRDGKLVGYQERKVKGKKFKAVGDGKTGIELVGQSLFQSGGRAVTITEGVLDAIAVYQSNYDKYGEKAKTMPVVSLPNGANAKALSANWDWITSFGKVVLMFDNDKVGVAAAQEVAKMLPAGKAFIAELPLKDASDMVKAGRGTEITNAFFNAVSFTPSGIVTSSATWDLMEAAKNIESIPYAACMQSVNDAIFGKRLGEIVLLTGGTGSGKTQFCREDIVHSVKTTDYQVGVCSLEEGIEDSVKGLMNISASKRLHLPTTEYTEEEYRAAWEDTMADDRIIFLDHQGSVSDDSLLGKIEYMIACGCKYIYLDHITIAVSDAEGSKNEAMDNIMSDLLKLTKRHNVWLCIVSHLRKTASDGKSFEEGAVPTSDDLKGSGSLKQIAFDIIAFSRNQYAKTEKARNTVSMNILKSRFCGNTGFAGKAIFESKTGRLINVVKEASELEVVDEEELEEEFTV